VDDANFARAIDGLVSLLLSFKVKPFIRYQGTSEVAQVRVKIPTPILALSTPPPSFLMPSLPGMRPCFHGSHLTLPPTAVSVLYHVTPASAPTLSPLLLPLPHPSRTRTPDL
jgi:hypothetical protein